MLFINQKNKTKHPIMNYGVIPLFLCLVLLLSSCTNIKAPVSQFNKYEIINVDFAKADLMFFFDIENPNDIPIGIKDINYNVALDGNNIVSGTNEGFSIQAREKKTVNFPVEISYIKLLGHATNLVKKFITRTGNVQYKIDGQLSIIDNVGFSARVPLNAEGELKLF